MTAKGLCILSGVAAGCVCTGVACGPPTSAPSGTARPVNVPSATLPWIGRGGGFREWGCGGTYIYGSSAEPSILDVWEWENHTLVKRHEFPVQRCVHPAWALNGRCFFAAVKGARYEPYHFYIVETKEDRATQCRLPDGWYVSITQPSSNGIHVAVCLIEESGEHAPPDRDRNRPRVKIGHISSDESEVNWVATLVGRESGSASPLRSVVPSNDGACVAVVGWDNGLAMIDAMAGMQTWFRQPAGEASLFYAAFAPDSKIVYTGGTMAAVYAMDVESGTELGRWYASPTGKAEYGHRISCLAVSPDGKWVAAGTGPEGLVFVGSTATNKMVKVLDHGGSTVLLVHFSPDSKALASFVPGTLKIWDVSMWDSSQTSTVPVSTSPAQ